MSHECSLLGCFLLGSHESPLLEAKSLPLRKSLSRASLFLSWESWFDIAWGSWVKQRANKGARNTTPTGLESLKCEARRLGVLEFLRWFWSFCSKFKCAGIEKYWFMGQMFYFASFWLHFKIRKNVRVEYGLEWKKIFSGQFLGKSSILEHWKYPE